MHRKYNSTEATGLKPILATALLLTTSALADSSQYSSEDDDENSGSFWGTIGQARIEADGPLQGLYGVGAISTDYSDSVDDGSVSMVGGNDEGFAYTGYAGYRFNEFFSVEASVTKSDNVDYNAMSDGSGVSWSAGPVSAEYDAEFYTLAALTRYPLAPKWWLIGKIGITYWETTETFNESEVISSDSENGTEVFLGLGLEYDVGLENRFLYRFELGYQPVGGNDDIDAYGASVGMRYEFP